MKWFKASARRYRWVVWSIMALAYMVVFFHRLAPGVVRDDLTAAFGISGAAFGNFASMYFYAYLIMQIPVGMLADSLGARKTASAGILLSGIGSIIFGFAPSIGWAYAGRFIVGIGVSTVFVCLLKSLSEWYSEKEFATMSGVTTLVGNFGGVIAQTPLVLMVGLFTWRLTFAGIGVMSFFLAAACFFLIRNRPSDMGFSPINPAGSEGGSSVADLLPALKAAVCSRAMWPATTLVALFAGAQLAFTGAWGVPWLTDVYGLPRLEASGIVSIVIFGAMAGGVLVGKISDMLGLRRLPLISVSAVNVIAWGVIVFWGSGKPPLHILKPALFVMGFASMALVLCMAVAKETNSPRYTGVALSVLNMGSFIGIAAFPPVMGAIIDLLSPCAPVVQYKGALMLCFAGAVIGLLLSFMVPETNCRNVTAAEASPTRS
ncbi:MAG: MFS transporter [Thermovirgaceae bacterium]|nr:MFS transporter [Thermovirgaceae bacterium]